MNRWQKILKEAITDPVELLKTLELDSSAIKNLDQIIKQFSLRVPRDFVNLMEKGNWCDPLLKQVLPVDQELEVVPGFTVDPLHEKEANPVPGLLHKYASRVLLTLSSVCGINCRYCFRRQFPYEDNSGSRAGWPKILDYIANDMRLNEVILSGGDPLMMPDKLLEDFVKELEKIPHIKTLRIHTRLPVVLPERITDELARWFSQTRLSPVLILHVNHPKEITPLLQEKMRFLQKKHVTLLNQSVLLKGVNDSIEVLTQLSESLFNMGVLPYYLHQLDKVHGTAHFAVEDAVARVLWQGLSSRMAGYLVPRLVREVPGGPAKQVLF